MNWPETGCGEKGLFLWPLALAGAQRASCLSAAHRVGIRLPGSCFHPSRDCNSGSIQLWHCLPLPCCCLVPTGANLTVPPMDPPSCTTIPVLRCGCLWKSPIPRNSQGLQTTVARKQGVFLPRRTPRIFAPTTLQHSALMAQPFPQHIPQGTNKAVQECPGLQEPGRMWPRGYPVMVWPLGKSSILPWAI